MLEAKIIWTDVVHWDNDISPGEMKVSSIDTYTTYGVILEDNSDYLIIASTIGFDELVKEGTRIPKVLIKEIKYLKEV